MKVQSLYTEQDGEKGTKKKKKKIKRAKEMKEKKKLAGCSCAEQHVFLDPAAVDLESAQGLEGGQGGLARGVKLDVLRGLDVVIGEEDAVARLLLMVAVHLCATLTISKQPPTRCDGMR